jgi:hypothetical protein
MSADLNSIDHFLSGFRQTIETAALRLRDIPEDQSHVKRHEDKWSPKEIIGHLIDSASNNHQRFVRAQLGKELVFQGYEQAEWVKKQRYNEEPWDQLIQLWKHYNLHLAHLISVIPEQTLTQSRLQHNLDHIAWETVDKDQPTTLEYFVRDYVAHLRHHLAQIFGDNEK